MMRLMPMSASMATTPPRSCNCRVPSEVAVEFNSLSKTYNMAGWRLGMAVGNADVIKMLSTYKSQMDSSIFLPILEAGMAALDGDQGWLEERNAIYQQRRDIVVDALRQARFRDRTAQGRHLCLGASAGRRD